MPFKTKDGISGIREDEEGTNYIDGGSLAANEGEVRYTSNRFSFFDGIGEYNPRSAGSFPIPDQVGQMLYAATATAFTKEIPVTTDEGFIVTI